MATSRVFPAWSLARASPTADASSSSGRRNLRRPASFAPSSPASRRAVVASVSESNGDARADDPSPSDAPSARAKSDAELVDARIRAERMAVRLKLQSAAGKSPIPAVKSAKSAKSAPASSLDAAIARERAVSRDAGRSSPTIDAERAAVRTRLNKFSMNRYAFVANGANAGRVVDRLTGEIAPVADDAASAIEDRVDLARERVKQAQQELQTAVAAADAKRANLDARVASLERLAETLARERKERAEEDADASRAEERRAVRAQLDVMTDPANAAQTKGAGAGAKKSATATTTTVGFEPATDAPSASSSTAASSSSSDARGRAEEAIRARASSSLSRLRKQRRIKRAGTARRTTSASMTNSAAVPAEDSTAVSLDDPLFEAAARRTRDEDDVRGSSGTLADVPASDSSVLPKPIFVLSDCTGESAANTCRAALSQFSELMNLSAPTNLYIFRFLSEGGDAYKICEQAAEDDALVVYTLSDADMATAVETACKLYGVKSVNLWGPLLAAMEDHLAMRTTGVPMSEAAARRKHSSSDILSTDYYRMIEAVEFTRQMDDGARPNRWKEADILILGVSRTGKTPLSIYLGQRGYKVANLPLVPRDGRLMVPEYVKDVDDARVFCLLIDGEVLHSIRANRLNTIGVRTGDESAREYATMRQVTQELSLAKALYARHPGWTVLDVTHKGVEETAARIMKIMFTNENANNFEVMKAT